MVAAAPVLVGHNGPHTVTVGLVQGPAKVGTIAAFSRYSPEIAVTTTVRVAEGEHQHEARIPASQVAYVAFHKTPDAPPPPRERRRKGLRVHTVSGPVFSTAVEASEVGNPIGFYAWPTDEGTPYRELFFYEHGVWQRESTDTLGTMLVRAGVRAREALSRTQATERDGEVTCLAASATTQDAPLQPRKRIGEILVEAGLATQRDVELALEVQRRGSGKRLGEVLVEMRVVTEVDLALALADHPDMMNEVPTELVQRANPRPAARVPTPAQPIAVPGNAAAARPAQDESVQRPAPAPAARPEGGDADEIEQILKQLQADDVASGGEAKPEDDSDLTASSDSAVIRLANRIILDGYRRGASDIHIEPNGRDRPTVIRFRIDGECSTYQEIPPTLRAPLVARLKIMARLDISERRKPQDGKIQLRIKDQKVELRVATLPTVADNEDVVMRILAASRPLPLAEMGLSERNLTELRKLVAKPYGLVLCVGPTGSGKTTTLHSALGSINTADTKIWTAEDPVEITQPGLRQVQVNSKIGFTFAAAMRAFLRADPDVIMVGEMRDRETASTAVEASLTGHLVLSTLHTNSAPETVTRLLDMGLDPFAFSDAILGVLAQRLARGLCKSCRAPYIVSEEEHALIADAYGAEALVAQFKLAPGERLRLWRGAGCSECSQSGYRGRIAIHELLVTDDPMRHSIAQRAPVGEIKAQAMRGGMHTLLQDGIEKAAEGKTDLTQVLAVCAK